MTIEWSRMRYPGNDPEAGPARQNPVNGCQKCGVKEALQYDTEGVCDVCLMGNWDDQTYVEGVIESSVDDILKDHFNGLAEAINERVQRFIEREHSAPSYGNLVGIVRDALPPIELECLIADSITTTMKLESED